MQSWPKILVNIIKGGCENVSALLLFLIFYLRNSQKSKLSLHNKNYKIVYSHSYSQFWALQGDYEHEIVLFHRNIYRREKAQIHLIIITMRIMLKHARSEAQISEVALRKELEQW